LRARPAVTIVATMLACQQTPPRATDGTAAAGSGGGEARAGAAGHAAGSGGDGGAGQASHGGGGAGGATAGATAGAAGSAGAGSAGASAPPPNDGPDLGPAAPDPAYAATNPGDGLPAAGEVPSGGKLKSPAGLVWWKAKGVLLVADEGAGAIFALTPPDRLDEWLALADAKPYGLALGPSGTLLVTSRAAGKILRVDLATKAVTTALAKVDGTVGDVVVAKTGDAYFTTTGEHSAVHRLAPDGTDSSLATYAWGAGLFLSLDQKNVEGPGDFAGHTIFRLPLDASGGAAGPIAVWTHPGREGGDGLCMDVAGNLYVPTRGGLEVIQPDGNRLRPNLFDGMGLGANCAFGGPDGKTVYYSVDGKLLRVAGKVPGLPE
jgi:gluconolactonase